MPRIAPLISCDPGTTDLAITGSGTVDGSGAMFWIWASKASLRYLPPHAMVPRPVLVSLRGVTRLHVDGITLTNSPSFHLAPSGLDITLENLHVVAPSDAPNTDALEGPHHHQVSALVRSIPRTRLRSGSRDARL
jgi:polygalacturonase